VAKFAADGSGMLYSTYLGGKEFDEANAIAVDRTGAAYVTGTTTSPDLPFVNPLRAFAGGFDVFVAKFTIDGHALDYSTYFGGSEPLGPGGPSPESGNGIAVDGTGAAYVTGKTGSANFPTFRALQPTLGGLDDAFVAKFATVQPLVPTFVGTPGTPNCHGQSVSALVQQFGGLPAAASHFGFGSVQALQDAISKFCGG